MGPVTSKPGRLGALGLAALFALARGPLHRATFALPVSNDDAIPLLMARHLLRGELSTTLWNQPYNGALDAYLLAPGLLAFSAHDVFRAYELAGALLLVGLVFLLARAAASPTAGWVAAGLAALGTPYMGLMTATGPPPNFLMPLVTGFPLAFVMARLAGSGRPRSPAPGRRSRRRRRSRPGRKASSCSSVSSAGWRCGTPRWPSRPSSAWRLACSPPASGPAPARFARGWPSQSVP